MKTQIKHTYLLSSCALVAVLTSGLANAGDDAVFASLKWDVGGGSQPSLVVGYRDVDTRNDNNIDGISFSVDYDFDNGFDQIILKGFNGGLNSQVEFGVGYSLQDKNLYGTAGLQGEYFNMSYDLGKGVERLNGEINTIGEYDVAPGTPATAPPTTGGTDGPPA